MSTIEEELVSLFNYIGQMVCHQMPERTLEVGGRYLPVCARDTGAYLGFFAGYFLLVARRKKAKGPPNLWVTVLMIIPMTVDAVTQLLGFRTSTNEIRLLTGLFFGTATAPFLAYLLSLVPLSGKMPILRKIIPEDIKLDDKDSWLSSKALGFGFLVDIVWFMLVNSVAGSANSLYYWLLSPPIIASIIMHIFLLPIFLALSLLIYVRQNRSKKIHS